MEGGLYQIMTQILKADRINEQTMKFHRSIVKSYYEARPFK